jgi:acetyl/propionyl-CoA carboxylase alpha subunit/acetyl-CoA carboxylase carboxyltransferase component
MNIETVLIANRGEIAIRVARACAGLGLKAVMIHSEDDANALHVKAGDEAVALKGVGARAYLDAAQVIAAANAAGADALHPGYGFLAENAAFARACAAAGIKFIGPRPEALETLGDKGKARALAAERGVPILPGTEGATSLAALEAFFDSLGEGAAMMIKAVAGGGGRGMRVVSRRADIKEAYERCASEAKAAFGDGGVYGERLIARARHIEVQIIGDGAQVVHAFERECSVQRRHQKLIETAPAIDLPEDLRKKLTAAAVTLGEALNYDSLGTIEFLVDADAKSSFFFIEANPRLQVEHTVTEEVMGLDLVETQIRLAGGESLAAQGITQAKLARPRGFAIQARVNAETMDSDGQVKPAGGVISAYEPPSGPGVRVDGAGYAGYAPNPNFDSLLAKVIVHARAGGAGEAAKRLARALEDFRLEGAPTNIALLANIVRHPDFAAGRMTTRYLEQNVRTLTIAPAAPRHFKGGAVAVAAVAAPEVQGPDGTVAVRAPLQSTLVSLAVAEGETVAKGQVVAVVEALKMEHTIEAPESGTVRLLTAAPGQVLPEKAPLFFLEPGAGGGAQAQAQADLDLDTPRPDLAELYRRLGFTRDANRPEAVEKRRKTGMRMARENIEELFDPGTFMEFGALTVAGQRRRRDLDDLMRNTPADGLIAGYGAVNGRYFDEEAARCVGLAYDYTVLAGTQGGFNHRKTDRMLEVAQDWKVPVVWFAEGGGGRPGDTEGPGTGGGGALSVPTFATYAELSGLVPRIGIAAGRCFAGNAVMFGLSDITIATKNSSIGMGGPAMIEGGGLGVYHPDEVGPIAVQTKNGVVDITVDDEAEATRVAKQALSYFQGPIKEWSCGDQRKLRHAVPENRLRVFDVREIISLIADEGWCTELRPDWGAGMITALIRIEGRPFGVIANNCKFLSGAIDADGADKAARMMALCDAFDLPIVSLCDTPGYIVGPEAEKAGAVRHGVRMYAVGSNVDVPVFTVVLRKAYGLGAMAMAQGRFDKPVFAISWPTGEFGGMGLEGAARLGNRRELEAIADPDERKKRLDQIIAASYERGKALIQAQWLQVDAVIDPADTRAWIMRGLKSMPAAPRRERKKRPWVDTW